MSDYDDVVLIVVVRHSCDVPSLTDKVSVEYIIVESEQEVGKHDG